MAGSAIGNLAVLLSLDTAAFESGANRASRLMRQTQRQFQQMGQRISNVGKGMSIGITAPFVGLMTQAIPAATQAREAMAQVEAGLKSMGGASGKTAEELKKSARELQRMSTFDDDDILRKVTANMLTFGNVSGENFDRAQKAVVNMATRLKMDLQPATIMIGKALNDPVKGLTAMGRAGIQFTEDQKEMIKQMVAAGDAAGAQAIILKELEKQFGGSAKAARDAAPGSDTIDAWRDFQETVGEIALNVLPPLTDILTRVLDKFNNLSPSTQKIVVGFVAFAAAVGPVLMVVGSLVSTFGTLLPLLIKLAPAFTALRIAALALMANPVILGFAAVLAGIYLAWQNWDKIEPIVRRLYNAVKTWILDRLNAVWDSLKQKIDFVKGMFKGLYTAVVGNSYIPDMVNGIAREMARLDAVMVQPVKKATSEAQQAFRDMARETQSLLDRLFPEARRVIDFRREMGLIDNSNLTEEQRRAARGRLMGEMLSSAQGRPDLLRDVQPIVPEMDRVQEALQRLTSRAQTNTVRIAKSFKDMADETLGALRRMTDAIRGGGFLGILEAVIGLGLQLGSIGAFGKTIAGRLNATPRALGGPISAGHPYLVGERGPELIVPGHSGRVVPNNRLGGNTYHIQGNLLTPEFWAAIQQGDMNAATAGSRGGVAMMQHRQTRRWR